jgi:subtilisin family serine protease
MIRMSFGFLFLVVACGKSGGGEKFGAPVDQTRAGVIASCTTKSQAASLAEKHGGAYRILNEKRGLVEFYNIPVETLNSDLPRSKLTQNLVYENLIENDFITSFSFGDFPYVGPGTRSSRNSNHLNLFPHLIQIDGFDLSQDRKGEGVTIAIVDSGVHYNHPHLAPNIRTNPRDPHGSAGNGRDDDKNGFPDDYAGWDFYNHDPYPIDDNGHGTHVAGLAAGAVGGVAPKAKILPVKVLNSRGSGDLGTIAAGILYAIDNGAHVVNLSLGGPAFEGMGRALDNLLSHIKLARDRNIVIVAAAGNGGEDGIGDCNDDFPVWPASIESENLIAVGAVNSRDQLTAYSNFGAKSVHVAAPGGEGWEGLLSTIPPNCTTNCTAQHAVYDRMSGTSMASPVVSGLVAIVKGARPSMATVDIRTHIMQTGTFVRGLDGVIQSAQVINVKGAVESL